MLSYRALPQSREERVLLREAARRAERESKENLF